MHQDWLVQIGELRATVSVGLSGVHRRIDDHSRFVVELHRTMLMELRRIDKRRNGGGGAIPYAKIAALLGLVILGALGHLAPSATRAAVFDLLKGALLHQASG